MMTRLRRAIGLLLVSSTRALCAALFRSLPQRLTIGRVPASPLAVFGEAVVDNGRLWDGKPVHSPVQLLHPHTDLGHRYWSDLLVHADSDSPSIVVDATAGNGFDSLVLAQALSRAGGGRLVLCDVQQRALDATRARLASDPTSGTNTWPTVEYRLGDHCSFLEGMAERSVTLITFNLGYLPGGDKSIVTTAEGTLRALDAAERAVRPGGSVSVTLYPGHEEGRREEAAVLEHAAALPQGTWSVHYTQWLNQRSKRKGIRAPSLVLLQKMN